MRMQRQYIPIKVLIFFFSLIALNVFAELADSGLSAVCVSLSRAGEAEEGPAAGAGRPARSTEVRGGAEANKAETGQQDRSQEGEGPGVTR